LSSYNPRHWVPILVAFYNHHELQWDYPFLWPPHGELLKCMTLLKPSKSSSDSGKTKIVHHYPLFTPDISWHYFSLAEKRMLLSEEFHKPFWQLRITNAEFLLFPLDLKADIEKLQKT